MKPYQGEIRNWTIQVSPSGYGWVIVGEQRGDYIRTSLIMLLNIEKGYVETKNSIYTLRELA